MSSYVIRVYRIDDEEPGGVFGTVEPVGGRERYTFSKVEDLWDILRRERSGCLDPQRQIPAEQG